MKKIVAVFALIIASLGIAFAIAGPASAAPSFSPTINYTCYDNILASSPQTCNAVSFNGSGHITRYYSQGTYTIVWKNGCGIAGSAYSSKLTFQGDGNLVEYNQFGTADFQTHTAGQTDVLALQYDGNVVLYHMDGQGRLDSVLWASNTAYDSTRQYSFTDFDNSYTSHGGGIYVLETNGVWAVLGNINTVSC